VKVPVQRFGETRSGKAINTYSTDDPREIAEVLKDFAAEDDFDAFALFQHLVRRELPRGDCESQESADFQRFNIWSGVHNERLGPQARQAQMDILSLVTSIAVAEYGNSRADDLFRD